MSRTARVVSAALLALGAGGAATACAGTAPPAQTVQVASSAPAAVPAQPRKDGAALWPWLTAGAGLVVVALLAGVRLRRPSPVHAPLAEAGRPGPAPVADPMTQVLRELAGSGLSAAVTLEVGRLLGHPATDRAALVRACVRYRDQLAGRDEAWRARMLAALESAGVREFRPDGHRFDPHWHEAVAAADPTGPAQYDTIAETTRVGYLDAGALLRAPQVVVYRGGSG